MNEALVIRNLAPVLAGTALLPTITRYNRLESRPRTDNFTRALRAEVRDALWNHPAANCSNSSSFTTSFAGGRSFASSFLCVGFDLPGCRARSRPWW